MLNEIMKKEATEMAHNAQDMVIPIITIAPITTMSEDEWKRMIYCFLELKTAIEDKIQVPLAVNVIDLNDDINPYIVDAVESGYSASDQELDCHPLNEG